MEKKVLPLLLLVIGFFVLIFFVVKNNRTNIQDNEVESENRKKAESVFDNDKDSTLTKVNENKKIVNGKKNSRNEKRSSTPIARDNEYGKKSKKKQSRFYGKVRVGVGYEYQKYAGDDVEYFKDIARRIPGYDIKRSNQAPVISLGYNLYYKLNNRFALLGGLEAQGRYPVSGSNFFSYAYASVKQKAEFGEYFRLNTKFGVKTSLNKKLDVETYGIIGMNVATYTYTYTSTYYRFKKHISNTNVGFTTGVGADLVIVDKFIVGLEYRYGVNKFKFEDANNFKMKTHSVLAKVGYQF